MHFPPCAEDLSANGRVGSIFVESRIFVCNHSPFGSKSTKRHTRMHPVRMLTCLPANTHHGPKPKAPYSCRGGVRSRPGFAWRSSRWHGLQSACRSSETISATRSPHFSHLTTVTGFQRMGLFVASVKTNDHYSWRSSGQERYEGAAMAMGPSGGRATRPVRFPAVASEPQGAKRKPDSLRPRRSRHKTRPQ